MEDLTLLFIFRFQCYSMKRVFDTVYSRSLHQRYYYWSSPILYINLLYKMGQDFLDIYYNIFTLRMLLIFGCFLDNSTLKLYIFLSIDDLLIWYVCIEGNLIFGPILHTISTFFILYIFLYSLERERGWYDMFILRMEQKQVQCKSELLSAWNRVFHFTSFLDNGCYMKQRQLSI